MIPGGRSSKMVLFTSTFTKTGYDERSEIIALLVSILFSLGFVVAFALWYEPEPEEEFSCTAISIPPAYDERPAIQKRRILTMGFVSARKTLLTLTSQTGSKDCINLEQTRCI